jgi:large subunit ribosomal protein L15
MDLHSLKNAVGARKRRKRIGRGMASGHGKTSGKGGKGQMGRKGHKHKIGFEGGQIPLIRRVPKRGFKNPTRRRLMPFNLDDLERIGAGSVVDETVLRSLGLMRGNWDGVKILGRGELSRAFTVKADGFSEKARAAIEAAGGSCEVVGP